MLERLSIEMGSSRGTRLDFGRCPFCNCCKKCLARHRSKSKEKVGPKARSKSSAELTPSTSRQRADAAFHNSNPRPKPRRDWEEPLAAHKLRLGKGFGLRPQEAKQRLADPGQQRPQQTRPRVRRRGHGDLEESRLHTASPRRGQCSPGVIISCRALQPRTRRQVRGPQEQEVLDELP